jgi:hypothetical protein
MPPPIQRRARIRPALSAFALLVLLANPVHAGTVTLAWDPNSDPVAGYILFYGTASGTYTTSVDCSTATLWSVAGLTDGQQYYFALVAYNASGLQSSLSNEVTTVVAPSGVPGQLTTPAPRSTLTGSAVQFQWAAGAGVSTYRLSVGTALGGTDTFDQSLGTSLNANVTGLPTDGGTVYVRLWSLLGSVWAFQDYTYTAATISPVLTINNVSVTAGTSRTTTATFTVTLSTTSSQTVTVAYATANGTATAGSDYVATNGTLTFAPGVSTRTLGVTVNADATPDADEAFVVNLSGPTNAVIGGSQGVGTIHVTAKQRRRR